MNLFTKVLSYIHSFIVWWLHISQNIPVIRWLESALWLLQLWEIHVDTTSEVLNAESDRLWTCNIAFDMPLRGVLGRRTEILQIGRHIPNRRGAEFNTVMRYLQASIGYQVPDYSFSKIQVALRERNPNMAQVSEWVAMYNQMDVVKSCMILDSCLFIVLLY